MTVYQRHVNDSSPYNETERRGYRRYLASVSPVISPQERLPEIPIYSWLSFIPPGLSPVVMIYISAIDIPLALLAAGLAVTYLWLRRRHHGLPLPPGPKGWPLIGNVFDMPMIRGWEVYHKWCKELETGLLYLNAAGTNIIVLDTYEDCVALMEKRSGLYSGR
jgi:hypothetical protein